MRRFLPGWRVPIPHKSRGALGVLLLLLFPSASTEAGLGDPLPLSAGPGSFRAILSTGEVFSGLPLGRARGGTLLFRLGNGKTLSLPVKRLRRLEPLPEGRGLVPGKKTRFPVKERDARRWVRLLYSPKGAERERGERELVRLGRPIRALLHLLVWTGPPEVSLRARRALRRIEALPWGQRIPWKGTE